MAAVFIDLDGTLTDPKTGIVRCLRFALDRLGIAIPENRELDWCIGPPLRDTLETLTGDASIVEEALSIYRERFSEIGLFENEPYPGIADALTRIAERVPALYVATSKPTVYAQRILDHFDLTRHFLQVFGSELDGARNDKSDLLAHALEKTGTDAARAVMVGDRRHDTEGARANGIATVGVLYGYGSEAELSQAGADKLVASPEHLPSAVFDLLNRSGAR